MKWLYRLEATDPKQGLWYNARGEFVFNIGELDECASKDLPMGYDERYQKDGKQWFSACTDADDLAHWFSLSNAIEMIAKGYKFYRYLAVDYVEYEKETVFLKETAIEKVEMSIVDVFPKEEGYGMQIL